MDYTVHGILQAKILDYPFFRGSSQPTQGSNPVLLHCRQILYQLSYQGSPNQQQHSENTYSILYSRHCASSVGSFSSQRVSQNIHIQKYAREAYNLESVTWAGAVDFSPITQRQLQRSWPWKEDFCLWPLTNMAAGEVVSACTPGPGLEPDRNC